MRRGIINKDERRITLVNEQSGRACGRAVPGRSTSRCQMEERRDIKGERERERGMVGNWRGRRRGVRGGRARRGEVSYPPRPTSTSSLRRVFGGAVALLRYAACVSSHCQCFSFFPSHDRPPSKVISLVVSFLSFSLSLVIFSIIKSLSFCFYFSFIYLCAFTFSLRISCHFHLISSFSFVIITASLDQSLSRDCDCSDHLAITLNLEEQWFLHRWIDKVVHVRRIRDNECIFNWYRVSFTDR